MIVTPAVDLRNGKCVQLVGGSYDRQEVELDDPVKVAIRWSNEGFKTLHVVDLDGATGRGANTTIVEAIIAGTPASVQAGGGIRSSDAVRRMIDAGADRVIVGTKALEDPAWLESIADELPGQIVLAVDVRERTIVAHGWLTSVARSLDDQLSMVESLPLAGILVTAVHKEGLMMGTDTELIRDVASQVPFAVQAAGGVASVDDLEELEQAGAWAVVLGMSLYTGRIDPDAIREDMKG